MNPSTIEIIGTDASGLRTLSLPMRAIVLEAGTIAGPDRILKDLPKWWEEEAKGNPFPHLINSESISDLINLLKKKKDKRVILASGDPLWFGIGRCLLEHFPAEKLCFHPAPSSLQLAFSRIGRPWQDASWVSLHGRVATPLVSKLKQYPNALAVLTDPNNGGAEEVIKILGATGLSDAYKVWLFEQLGHIDERVTQIESKDDLPDNLNPLNLILLIRQSIPSIQKEIKLPTFGLPDGLFVQNNDRPGLMTKRETRIQILADLELPEEGILWDIGAGVGSIGLEALRLKPKLQLMAVEKRTSGYKAILENATRLNVEPAAIYEANAVELLSNEKSLGDLEYPDRVVISGGGSERAFLLKKILKKLKPNGIIVIPLATLESLVEVKPILEKSCCKVTVSQLQVWKGLPLADGTRFSPMNPIIILKGEFLQ